MEFLADGKYLFLLNRFNGKITARSYQNTYTLHSILCLDWSYIVFQLVHLKNRDLEYKYLLFIDCFAILNKFDLVFN